MICKPGSVPPRQSEERGMATIIPLGRPLLDGSSDHTRGPLAGSRTLLFDLAPGGVCRASLVSPGSGELLPHRFALTDDANAVGGLISVALSPSRDAPPLTATLPCGVRTFLPTGLTRPATVQSGPTFSKKRECLARRATASARATRFAIYADAPASGGRT